MCVPLLRWYGAPQMPLDVSVDPRDLTGLVAWMLLAIVAGMVVVAVWPRRLRVTSALRLGEDG